MKREKEHSQDHKKCEQPISGWKPMEAVKEAELGGNSESNPVGRRWRPLDLISSMLTSGPHKKMCAM